MASETRRFGLCRQPLGRCSPRYSVYLIYWYKSTNTDACVALLADTAHVVHLESLAVEAVEEEAANGEHQGTFRLQQGPWCFPCRALLALLASVSGPGAVQFLIRRALLALLTSVSC